MVPRGHEVEIVDKVFADDLEADSTCTRVMQVQIDAVGVTSMVIKVPLGHDAVDASKTAYNWQRLEGRQWQRRPEATIYAPIG
jgi:hypothetical protein